jgi:putative transposase
MPRGLRYELTDIPQHVVQRGNNRQRTFFCDQDCTFYLGALKETATAHGCAVHAYVLMPNHVHLLMTPLRPKAISTVIQSLGRRYVRYINERHQRTGTLWEGRHKASLVATESYLMNCYRYIELNPVRAGMVRGPGEYRWSSYPHNALNRIDGLITEHPEYISLGSDRAQRAAVYRQLFTEPAAQVIDEIRQELNLCRAFGPESFKSRIAAALKRPLRPGKAGRPPKKKGRPDDL